MTLARVQAHEADPGEGHDSGVAADELLAFVERIERVQAEIDGLNGDKSDIFKELKSQGFDVQAVRSVLRIRRMDHATRQERDAILALYCDALGIT